MSKKRKNRNRNKKVILIYLFLLLSLVKRNCSKTTKPAFILINFWYWSMTCNYESNSIKKLRPEKNINLKAFKFYFFFVVFLVIL